MQNEMQNAVPKKIIAHIAVIGIVNFLLMLGWIIMEAWASSIVYGAIDPSTWLLLIMTTIGILSVSVGLVRSVYAEMSRSNDPVYRDRVTKKVIDSLYAGLIISLTIGIAMIMSMPSLRIVTDPSRNTLAELFLNINGTLLVSNFVILVGTYVIAWVGIALFIKSPSEEIAEAALESQAPNVNERRLGPGGNDPEIELAVLPAAAPSTEQDRLLPSGAEPSHYGSTQQGGEASPSAAAALLSSSEPLPSSAPAAPSSPEQSVSPAPLAPSAASASVYPVGDLKNIRFSFQPEKEKDGNGKSGKRDPLLSREAQEVVGADESKSEHQSVSMLSGVVV